MTTRFDDDMDDLESAPDDPLAVILRAPSGHLTPPPGRYAQIRRTASRRRVLRTAAGFGVTCAIAALVTVPLYFARPVTPASPAPPQAPPPASGRTMPPVPSPVPTPSASTNGVASPARTTPPEPAYSSTAIPGATGAPRTPVGPVPTAVPSARVTGDSTDR
ncbi:hypothetical protein I3F58_28505 [Streptomyces sp. MUM 203J]|uniref:hypothetical protein n=1 Tax=Streptomyces sp. MUM 203J TaxID=2791990 RepID=UPI001F0456DF|nr:hypothetical protein [Streptomyces sp. MUM 203J]MCH0543421.1 hypothetical protein [Streptomyces sp. MUM 203J]